MRTLFLPGESTNHVRHSGSDHTDPETPRRAPAGLCDTCSFQRLVTSGKGSTFSLCELSKQDPDFPRYPRLPVLACAGHTPHDA